MIDDPDTGGSESGAWKRALDRGCLQQFPGAAIGSVRVGKALTDNDKGVIRERHAGWEGASPGLLAKVFGVSVQRINAVLKEAAPC